MNIQSHIDNLAAALSGTNALITIHINGKCYIRKIGDVNRITDNPTVMNDSEHRSFLEWMHREVETCQIADPNGLRDDGYML